MSGSFLKVDPLGWPSWTKTIRSTYERSGHVESFYRLPLLDATKKTQPTYGQSWHSSVSFTTPHSFQSIFLLVSEPYQHSCRTITFQVVKNWFNWARAEASPPLLTHSVATTVGEAFSKVAASVGHIGVCIWGFHGISINGGSLKWLVPNGNSY